MHVWWPCDVIEQEVEVGAVHGPLITVHLILIPIIFIITAYIHHLSLIMINMSRILNIMQF